MNEVGQQEEGRPNFDEVSVTRDTRYTGGTMSIYALRGLSACGMQTGILTSWLHLTAVSL